MQRDPPEPDLSALACYACKRYVALDWIRCTFPRAQIPGEGPFVVLRVIYIGC